MSADPTIAAARDLFEEAVAELRASLEGASIQTLNARPAGEDTNPLAVLAIHALMSTRMWLACALGAPPPARDRPAEFETVVRDAAELLGTVAALSEDCRRLLATEAPFDAAAVREEPSSTPGEPPEGTTTTAAWALLHALEHLREHTGQAGLTRQVLDRAS